MIDPERINRMMERLRPSLEDAMEQMLPLAVERMRRWAARQPGRGPATFTDEEWEGLARAALNIEPKDES
jgi:hypothetical protein